MGNRFVKDRHGIIRGPAAGQRLAADDARIADAAGIHAKAFDIVITQQLAGHLAYAVHGRRPQDGLLGRVVPRRVGAKHSDGTGTKNPGQLLFPGYFQDIVQAVDVDLPGQVRPLLADGGEDGRHVIDGIDLVLVHHRFQRLAAGYVDELEWPLFAENCTRFCLVPGGDHVLAAVAPP